jgi:hypothetical protein
MFLRIVSVNVSGRIRLFLRGRLVFLHAISKDDLTIRERPMLVGELLFADSIFTILDNVRPFFKIVHESGEVVC